MTLPALLLAQTLLSLPPRLTSFPSYEAALPATVVDAPTGVLENASIPTLFPVIL